jgi:aminotransferase
MNIEPSSIRKMFNLASVMDDIVNLGIGEPDFTTPPNILEAAERAMRNGKTHYTLNAGIPVLREAVADKLIRKNNINADPESEVIITNGAMGGLYLTMQVLLDHGDEVILPVPSWTNYSAQILLAGGIPVPLKTESSKGFLIDPEQLKKLINVNTKAVLINTPANPTGAVYDRNTLEAIAAIAIEHNLFVISDEVYEYFIWEGLEHYSIASIVGMSNRTITINSFSKTFAMTGWRVGYTSAPAEIIRIMTILQENIYACVNSIAQAAAVEALTGTQKHLQVMIEEYGRRRLFMSQAISDFPGLRLYPPQGAFYMAVDIRDFGLQSDAFSLQLLERTGVCLVPGTAFGGGGEDFVRISYANKMSELEKAVERLCGFLQCLN